MVWNKRMLTTEDFNSVVEHFGKGFVDYYVIDTRNISIPDTNIGYDFLDITQTTNTFSFDVKNSLWTRGYRILNTDGEDITVSITNNVLLVTGTNLTYIVLELELSTIRTPFDSPTDIFYEVSWFSVMRPFYETNRVSVRYADQDEAITNLAVYISDMQHTGYTNDDGYITVRLDPKAPGNYTSQLRAYLDPQDLSKGNVDYFYPYKRFRVELPVRLLNDRIIRDKTNLLEFEFLFDDEYTITEEMLFEDNYIRLKVDGKYYEVNMYEDTVFSFEVPISSADKVNIQLEINGNEYLDNYVLDYTVDTVYATFNSASALKTELESDGSASTVVFNGSVLDTSILINRDVNLIFDGVCNSSLDSVFNIDNGALFSVSNANFTGKNFITINNGGVELVDSSFNHCTSIIIKGNGNLTVDNCSFVDNNACIDVTGTVNVKNSLFDLSDVDYLNTSVIPFLDVYGNLDFDFCQFSLDLHELTTLGYSYVILKIGGDYMTNGIENNRLLENGKFKMLNNISEINVESNNYHITGKNNKAITWNVINTNQVWSNNLNVIHIEGD